jgi:hypothetical protein
MNTVNFQPMNSMNMPMNAGNNFNQFSQMNANSPSTNNGNNGNNINNNGNLGINAVHGFDQNGMNPNIAYLSANGFMNLVNNTNMANMNAMNGIQGLNTIPNLNALGLINQFNQLNQHQQQQQQQPLQLPTTTNSSMNVLADNGANASNNNFMLANQGMNNFPTGLGNNGNMNVMMPINQLAPNATGINNMLPGGLVLNMNQTLPIPAPTVPQLTSPVADQITTIVIFDLPTEVGDNDVFGLAQQYGAVHSVDFKRDMLPSYCLVSYFSYKDAETAIRRLNGAILRGKYLRVNMVSITPSPVQASSVPVQTQQPTMIQSQSKPAAAQGNNSFLAPGTTINAPKNMRSAQVHISYLSKQLNFVISEHFLKEVFSKFGQVLEIALKKTCVDPEMSVQNGYGFVHYPLNEEGINSALNAVASLHQVTINQITFDCSISNQLNQILSSHNYDKNKARGGRNNNSNSSNGNQQNGQPSGDNNTNAQMQGTTNFNAPRGMVNQNRSSPNTTSMNANHLAFLNNQGLGNVQVSSANQGNRRNNNNNNQQQQAKNSQNMFGGNANSNTLPPMNPYHVNTPVYNSSYNIIPPKGMQQQQFQQQQVNSMPPPLLDNTFKRRSDSDSFGVLSTDDENKSLSISSDNYLMQQPQINLNASTNSFATSFDSFGGPRSFSEHTRGSNDLGVGGIVGFDGLAGGFNSLNSTMTSNAGSSIDLPTSFDAFNTNKQQSSPHSHTSEHRSSPVESIPNNQPNLNEAASPNSYSMWT